MRKLVYILAALILALASVGPAHAGDTQTGVGLVRLPGLDRAADSVLAPWVLETNWFTTDFLGTGEPSPSWAERPERFKTGSFSAKLLPLSAYSGTAPAFQVESEMEQASPYGWRLAMAWQADHWGVAFGGGYSRTAATLTDAANSSGPKAMISSGGSNGSNSSTSDILDRWSAFVAVPYKISDRFGLRPEFSYYYGEPVDNAAEAENEWVMGLQFNFGF